jgi:phosphoglycerate-specific signal transduction histidine kinase
MVEFVQTITSPASVWLFAQAESRTVLERLTPDQRMRLILAIAMLAGVLLFGIFLVFIVGRLLRRYTRNAPRSSISRFSSVDPDDWARKPLYVRRPRPPEEQSE